MNKKQKQEDILVNTFVYLVGLVIGIAIPGAWISIPIIAVIAMIRIGKLEDEVDE